MIVALSVILTVSLCVNVYLAKQLERLKKAPQPTQDAKDLLHSLTRSGMGLVKVEIIDPTSLLIWKGKI